MKEKLLKYEPVLFLLILGIHLLPVLFISPFVTLDGPTHLYNSNLIRLLISDPGFNGNRLFEFNPFPEPNWTISAFAAIFLAILPAWLAEKMVLITIILVGATGFRKLCLLLNPGSGWLSWLYFPFIYNFTFCVGFYNYSLGFALLPWIFYLWMKMRENENRSLYLIFSLVSLLLYFSHLAIFLFAGFFLGIISLSDFMRNRKKSVKELGLLLLLSFPGFLLGIIYLLTNGTAGYRGEILYLAKTELVKYISEARVFGVYSEQEFSFSCIFFYAMILFTVLSILKRSFHKYQKPFLVILILSLLMVFTLPDSMASGGILSIRLVKIFYFTWCIWLITLNIPVNLRMLIAGFAALFSIIFICKHYPTQKELSSVASSIIKASERMEENKTVLPLNYGNNWLHSNLACYIGAYKKLVVLDNYEATTTTFPLLWKKGMNTESDLGNYTASNNPCLTILHFEEKHHIKVDYITIENMPLEGKDSCSSSTLNQLQELYNPLQNWNDKNIKVFVRR